MSKKILITGAAGFIGSHLAERLIQEGHGVTGIDNYDPFYDKAVKQKNIHQLLQHDNFKLFELDITNRSALLEIKETPDIIIHIAARAGVRPSIENPTGYIDTNISGTQNILDFMKGKNCTKLIFASSSSVYGNNKSLPFSEEDDVSNAISPYAFTKKANEIQIHTYHHLYNIDAICLRFFTVYGPRQRPDLAIHKFANLIRSNKPIQMYGDGKTGRDYTYIADVVTGIIQSMHYVDKHENTYEILNIGNSSPVLLDEMIDMMYRVFDKEKNIERLPMQPGDVDFTYADINKAKKMIGYTPKTSFEEGIGKFADWFN